MISTRLFWGVRRQVSRHSFKLARFGEEQRAGLRPARLLFWYNHEKPATP